MYGIYGRIIWVLYGQFFWKEKPSFYGFKWDFQFYAKRFLVSENQHVRSEKNIYTGVDISRKITILVIDEIDVTGEFSTARYEYATGIPHPQPAALARFVSYV